MNEESECSRVVWVMRTVVGLNNRTRELRGGVNAELQLGLFATGKEMSHYPTKETWRASIMAQLREVEVCELKPKYKVEVTKWRSSNPTALVEPERLHMSYITQGLWVIEGSSVYTKDKRALIVAQRTCDEEVLNYVSSLETVRTKVYLNSIEIPRWRLQEELDQVLRYIWVRLSWVFTVST